MIRIKSFFLLAILFVVPVVFAQQFETKVNLIIERLPLDKQEKLKDLADNMETYFNDTDWTGEDFEEPIQLTVQIFFEDKSTTFEDRYAGTCLISNNLDVQYSDKYWRFPLQADETLAPGSSGSPFTGFLDFYTYIILGHEYDKMGRFAGAEFFEKAKGLADQGLFTSQFSLGWKERVVLIDRLMSEAYKPFREMKDEYFLGLSLIDEGDETAKEHLFKALNRLINILNDDPEHHEAEQFLDANYIDIIDLFQKNSGILRRLSRVDPDHKDTYQKYIDQN